MSLFLRGTNLVCAQLFFYQATENGPRLERRKKRTPEDEDGRTPKKGWVRAQQTTSSLDISNSTTSANNRTDRDTLWTPEEIGNGKSQSFSRSSIAFVAIS